MYLLRSDEGEGALHEWVAVVLVVEVVGEEDEWVAANKAHSTSRAVHTTLLLCCPVLNLWAF
jgi:hypothetical protein